MSDRLPNGPEQVTERQIEVARLVAGGRTNAQIAEALGISLDGAKYHVSELLGRLGLTRRDEIAGWYRSRRRRRLRVLLAAPLARALGAAGVLGVAAVAGMVGLVVVGAILLANADNSSEDAEAETRVPPATSAPQPALAAPAQEPDAADAVRDEARATLAQVPGVAEVVAAVESGDVDGLMSLFVRRESFCYATRRDPGGPCGGDGCPGARHDLCVIAGVGDDTPIETIWMRSDGPCEDSTFRFLGFHSLSIGDSWLEQELRPVLESMIGERGGRLEVAERRRFYLVDGDGNAFFEDWYQLGFSTATIDGTPLGAFNAGVTVPLNGLGFFVVAGAEPPVARFILLGPGAGDEARPHLPTSLPAFALGPPPPQRLPSDPPEAAAVRGELAAIPALAAIIAAAEVGDAETLISLMQTEVRECFPTSIRHDFDACVGRTGAIDGNYLVVPADPETFINEAYPVNSIMAVVGVVGAREPPRLSLVGRPVAGRDDGVDYVLIFRGLPASVRDVNRISLGDAMLTGYAVAVNLDATLPIVRFTVLTSFQTPIIDWFRLHYGRSEVLFASPDR